MVSFSPESMQRSMERLVENLDQKLGGHGSEASMASNMSLDTILSKRALSHASVRTSTTESSLHLQGRTKEGDHDEIGPFINEEKFQAERIVAQRGQRERDRRHFLQEDRGIRGICYRLMQNQGIKALSHIVAFLTFALVIVLANAAADMLRFPEDQQKIRSYRQLESLMTVLISLYIVEVIISFIGCPITPRIYDGWLVLDVFIASIAFLDEFILEHFHSLGIMRTTRAVRLLRILRVGRICRLFELVRNFPLIALVLIETSIRLTWMFAIWSIIGWCAAAIITVIIGAEGFSELPDIEDPLLQAIINAGSCAERSRGHPTADECDADAPHLLGTQHLETADAPELSPECGGGLSRALLRPLRAVGLADGGGLLHLGPAGGSESHQAEQGQGGPSNARILGGRSHPGL